VTSPIDLHRGYPSRVDANPYALLDHLGTASAVERSVTAALSRFGTALPVPLLGSTYQRAWCDVLASLGLHDRAPLRHYVARRGGEPVASATVFLGAGVAGLYFVATPPAWRGAGLGTAVTLHALAAARAAGYDTAVLGAEAPAVDLYRRLGFRPRGVMRVYAG
jgi:GNAT superfamily N-acetyltransferase